MDATESMNFNTLAEYARRAESFSINHDALDEYGDWLVTFGWNRDSDAIMMANKASIEEMTEKDEENITEISFNHFACGWVAYKLVKKDSLAHQLIAEAMCSISEYPILEDDKITTCDSCDHYVLMEEVVYGYDGSYCSEDCKRSEWIPCDDCGEPTDQDDLDEDGLCDDCELEES